MTAVPSHLPVRHSARVLFVDRAQRVLLFQAGPADPLSAGIWFTPGGGVEPGEDLRTAALRELREETGFLALPAALLGPVWHRIFRDEVAVSDETFFLLRVDAHEVDAIGWTDWERRFMAGHRWWSVAELLQATDQVFAPRAIGRLLADVLRRPWAAPMLEVGV